MPSFEGSADYVGIGVSYPIKPIASSGSVPSKQVLNDHLVQRLVVAIGDQLFGV